MPLKSMWGAAFALMLLFCSAAPCGAEVSEKGVKLEDEDQHWARIIESRSKGVKDYLSQLALYESLAGSECSELDKIRAETETRIHEIRLVFMNNISNPYHFRLMRREYRRNISRFEKQIVRVENLKKINETYLRLTNDMLADIRPLEQKRLGGQNSGSLKSMEESLGRISGILERIGGRMDEALEPAHALSEQIQGQISDLNKGVPGLIDEYFLNRDKRFSSTPWGMILNSLMIWKGRTGRAVAEHIPNSPDDLLVLLALLAFAGLPMMLAGRILGRRLCDRYSAPPEARRLLRRALWFGTAAAVLYIYDIFLIFPENIVTTRLSLLLALFAIADLGWALSWMRCGACARFNPPAMPILWILAINFFFQTLDVPVVVNFILWPLTVLAFAEPMRRIKNMELPSFEKSVAALSFWGAFAVAALSLAGYHVLSVLLVLAFLMFSTGLQLASNMGYYSSKLIIEIQKTVRSDMLKIVILGLGVPVIWTGILFLTAYWFADQLIEPLALLQFLGVGISVFGVELNVLKLLSGIFLFVNIQ